MKIVRYYIKDTDILGKAILSKNNDKELTPIEGPTNISSLDQVTILPPCTPSKIVCVASNYRSHCIEMKKSIPDHPIFFIKPSTSIIPCFGNIIKPNNTSITNNDNKGKYDRVDYEGELAVVISKKCRSVKYLPNDDNYYKQFIYGYTILNDVTVRDLQKLDTQFTRAKGFDTFAPIGPCILVIDTNDKEINPNNLKIITKVNNVVKQNGDTNDMIFDIKYLLSAVTSFTTLLPGDIISTGTPVGVGPLYNDDVVDIEIEHIGHLVNTVIDEKSEE